MSRRFGRRQKAKMRQQLEMEKALREWYVKHYHEIHDDYERLVTMIERVQPYSVLTPVKTQKGNPEQYLQYNVPMHHNFMMDRVPTEGPELCQVDRAKLNRLDVTLRDDASGFAKLIHLKMAGDAKVGYYMSDEALYQFGVPVEFIAKEIAQRFIEDGKKEMLK